MQNITMLTPYTNMPEPNITEKYTKYYLASPISDPNITKKYTKYYYFTIFHISDTNITQ